MATKLTEFDGICGEMIGDWILDDTEELLASLHTANTEFVE